MKRIFFKEEYCIGCRLCEVACVVAHSKSGDPIKAYKEEIPRPKPRIKIQVDKEVFSTLICHHCLKPSCVLACPTGALFKREDGKVELDLSRCINCWNCIAFCPFQAIFVDWEQNLPLKCDLCPHLPTPACVRDCPNRALVVSEG